MGLAGSSTSVAYVSGTAVRGLNGRVMRVTKQIHPFQVSCFRLGPDIDRGQVGQVDVDCGINVDLVQEHGNRNPFAAGVWPTMSCPVTVLLMDSEACFTSLFAT